MDRHIVAGPRRYPGGDERAVGGDQDHASSSSTTTPSCAARCGPCSTAARTSRWWGRPATSPAPARRVADVAPDVLVLDVNLPDGLGADAVAGLREAHPGTQIVLLTMERDIGLARRALDDGALGYLFKDAAHLELVEAVRAAAAGRALRAARGRRRALPRAPRTPPRRRSRRARPTSCG